jgi:hypothetical protein
MSRVTEKFYGLFDFSSEFLQRLDRNFTLLATELSIYKVTTDFTLRDSDSISSIQANATTAALTVRLPVSPTGTRRRTIIKTDASGNAVTVNGNGSLINGAATQVLAAQYNFITVEPTGTGWLIVAS